MNTMVSIIYLTKNGGDLFRKSLVSIFSQDTSFNYEVIAVDSGSTDNTIEVMKEYPVSIYTIKPEEFNFGLSRDYAFSLARGDILITISQDAVPADRNWLNNLVSPFEDENIAAVQGHDSLPPDIDTFFWLKKGLFYYTKECRNWMNSHNGIGLSFVGCAIRRSVWEDNKLGPVEMSEDKVLQKKLYEKGYKIIYQKSARTYHSHQYDLRDLVKRCENEGLGWRNVGQNYSFFDMISDFFNYEIMKTYLIGLIRCEMKRLSEFLFPFIRPIFIYKGNHFTKKYVR